MNNKDNSFIEDLALAFGCLFLSYSFAEIFDLPKFLFTGIFITLYIFLLSNKQKSKKKKQEELLKQQLEIKKKYLEKQKRIEKEYEPYPNQISLFDPKKYETDSKTKEKNETQKNKQQKSEIKSNKTEKREEPKKEEKVVIPMNKSSLYVFEYDNENEFRKLERSIKKYNMLAYKKLFFEYYPKLKEGNFLGKLISSNQKDKIEKYELELPTEKMFREVHDSIILHYTVYKKEKVIFLNTITPTDILLEGHKDELLQYKGVMVSKRHAEKDMFKINLLNMLNKD